MPVDARPVAGGNIDLSDDVSVRSTPRAEIVPADPTAVRYTSHFVTCPDADKHRRR